MENDNATPAAEELTTPRFDTLTTNRAHPVVPLSDTPEAVRRPGILSGILRARPAVLVVAAILLAAVIVAAATAIFRQHQSAVVTGSAQGLDSSAPTASQPVEDASLRRVNTTARRRANLRSTAPTVPLETVPGPAVRDEVLGTIRRVLQERSRSRLVREEKEEKDDRRGKHGDKHDGKDKRGKDGDGH